MTKASAASLEIDPTRGLLYGSSIGCALVVSLAVQLKNAGASAIQPRFLILDRSLSFFFCLSSALISPRMRICYSPYLDDRVHYLSQQPGHPLLKYHNVNPTFC